MSDHEKQWLLSNQHGDHLVTETLPPSEAPTREYLVEPQRCANRVRLVCRSLLLTFILTIFTFSLLSWQLDSLAPLKSKKLCTSAACVHAASEILHNLSPDYKTIDPCENFYELTCAGFEEKHDLRPDQGATSRTTIMAEDAQLILRHILESDGSAVAGADKEIFNKLKADYTACMDEKTIVGRGLEPLKDVMAGLTELCGEDKESQKGHGDLTCEFAYLHQLGVNAPIYVNIGADDKYPEVQIPSTGPAGLSLPSKEYYKNKKTVAEFEDVVNQILPKIIPGLESRAEGDKSIGEEIVAFESEIAKISPEEEDLNDITKVYNKLTLEEFDALLPQIDLKTIITALAPGDYTADNIIVASPDFAKDLSSLINGTSETVLQSYMIWHLIGVYHARLEDPILEPLERFNKKLQGKDPDAKPDRWRTCVSVADSDLGWIMSKFFVDKAFSPAAKKFGDQVVLDIKSSFVKFLKKAKWMTNENRDRAITKVNAIDQKIGYPTSNPNIMDPADLEKYYDTVSIGNASFFENAAQAKAFEVRQSWAQLGKPSRHDQWLMTAATVNAYYNPAGNEIVFPAGIMQSPVFHDPTVPQYLSYGAFGAVGGHELSHAFDNTGSQYDETGKYNDWWSNETRVAFEEKTQCFVKQYANYSITSPDGDVIHVNGKLTLGENVADAGGIHAAFKAWKKREAKHPSQALPGLEYFTKEQLFFVNYANFWCGKTTAATAVRRIYTDPHSPQWARVLGTMANSADFRKAFKCPVKKPTCELW